MSHGFNASRPLLRKHTLALAVSLLSCLPSAHAFELVSNEDSDWSVRFDNTIKFSYGQRVEAPKDAITRTANFNDGDLNFKRGRPVTQRIDALSEFDVVYKQKMGFRVSAASWYDAAYRNVGNRKNLTPGGKGNAGNLVLARDFGPLKAGQILVGGQPDTDGLSNFADRFYNGPSAEILDAFVFMNHEFDNGQMLNVKLGSHTQFWGESLFNATNSISYGQSALDLGKLYSVPGTEAKELFRPRNQLSASYTVNPELTLAGQVFLEYESSRFPEGGTYYGPYDMLLDGGEVFWLPLPTAAGGAGAFYGTPRGRDVRPKERGDFGLMAKWSPAWLDGTLGAYYREFTDILPFVVVDAPNLHLGGPGAVAGANYFNTYGSDIKLYGLSLAKNVGSVSVGADLNYRRNMTLASNFTTINAPAANALAGTDNGANLIASRPGRGETGVARGNTLHAVVNGLATFAETPFWDASSLAVEANWVQLQDVTSGENTFKGHKSYRGIDKVSKNAYGIAASFTPTWFQVIPGVDLSAPLSVNTGIGGNSAVQFGSYRGAGSYAVGVAADVLQKYKVDLRYIDAFGRLETCKTGNDNNTPGANGLYQCIPGQITSSSSLAPLLKDRGMVVLSVKMTF